MGSGIGRVPPLRRDTAAKEDAGEEPVGGCTRTAAGGRELERPTGVTPRAPPPEMHAAAKAAPTASSLAKQPHAVRAQLTQIYVDGVRLVGQLVQVVARCLVPCPVAARPSRQPRDLLLYSRHPQGVAQLPCAVHLRHNFTQPCIHPCSFLCLACLLPHAEPGLAVTRAAAAAAGGVPRPALTPRALPAALLRRQHMVRRCLRWLGAPASKLRGCALGGRRGWGPWCLRAPGG